MSNLRKALSLVLLLFIASCMTPAEKEQYYKDLKASNTYNTTINFDSLPTPVFFKYTEDLCFAYFWQQNDKGNYNNTIGGPMITTVDCKKVEKFLINIVDSDKEKYLELKKKFELNP